MKAKVSLVRSKDSYEGVGTCLRNLEADLKQALSTIPSVLVKVNFVDTRKELACTPYQAVKSFIDFITGFYERGILIAESPTWGVAIDGFEKYGFYELGETYPQVSFLNLKEDETVTKEINKIALPFSKSMLDAPFIVSMARPKTHSSVVVTLGIKNVIVGAINKGYKYRIKVHKGIHRNFLDLTELVYPSLVVLDGTVGMEGRGPIMGTKKQAGWCIASLDPLAADTLATYLMGYDFADIDYLRLMSEAQKGATFPKDNIEVIGNDPEELLNPFQSHPAYKQLQKHKNTAS
jgi:uncharacterized protein (DUF362 family)